MSKSTILAETQIIASPHNVVTVELFEADGVPAVVIVTWPLQPTVLHPQRFPDAAATLARVVRQRRYRTRLNQKPTAVVMNWGYLGVLLGLFVFGLIVSVIGCGSRDEHHSA